MILLSLLLSSAPTQAAEAAPCSAIAYRQFDFWVGRWTVARPDGVLAGENQIEAILDGCALEERWTGATGAKGRSLTMYDAAEDRWHQTWVDGQGGRLLLLTGGLAEDGAMVLAGDVAAESGSTTRHEIRWVELEDDVVQQLWRTSKDGGETWTVAFDGRYIPAGAVPRPAYRPMSGDVIFHTSVDAQSQAIQLATSSRYSHVGLVAVDEDGEASVYEAIGPVTLTPLDDWIAHGEGGRYTAMRLAEPELLTPAVLEEMVVAGLGYLDLPYDWAFGWSDEWMYCSELVWKIYKEGAGIELSELQRIGDFDLSHPAVKAKIVERYGDNIPLDEPAVSPKQLAASDMLVTIYSNYK